MAFSFYFNNHLPNSSFMRKQRKAKLSDRDSWQRQFRARPGGTVLSEPGTEEAWVPPMAQAGGSSLFKPGKPRWEGAVPAGGSGAQGGAELQAADGTFSCPLTESQANRSLCRAEGSSRAVPSAQLVRPYTKATGH